MFENLVIAIHDFKPCGGAIELARVLNADPWTSELSKVAVLTKSDSRESWSLSELGFEQRVVDDNASNAARKNEVMRGAKGAVLFLSCMLKVSDLGFVEKMMDELERRGADGIVGCKLQDEKGAIVNAGYHVIQPTCELLPEGNGKKDLNQFYYSREVEGIDSRCMLISPRVASSFLFDTELGAFYDDMDFCLKVKIQGFPLICIGGAPVVVSQGEDGSTISHKETEVERYRKVYRRRWEEYYKNRYETRVMWHSWINAPTGYAVSSQYLVSALEILGVDVRYGFVYGVEEPPNDDERIMEVRRKPKDLSVTQVVYGQGDVFFKNSGRYKVGYSMLEVDGIPPDWVEQANVMDEVWVPSHFNKETFKGSGVKKPIYVMPLGVDTDYFHPFISTRSFGEKFAFLSVFEWGERKAPEILLRAYNEEFSGSDDVVLILKITNTDPAVNIERQVEDIRLIGDRAPIVMIVNQNIPTHEMGALYCACNCFVLPTRGEGWGMPTLEAMSCGLPVISTHWSAQTEFLNDEVAYPLAIKGLVPAVAKCPYYKGWKWAEPDEDHLRSLMRHVYENREEAKARGLRAALWAKEKWTWLNAASHIKERLSEISG
ncbi:MAG: glycosyltransferase [Actinomycetota bacterium]|nr:glycosyltransferase [Actinomycetota bacterium]